MPSKSISKAIKTSTNPRLRPDPAPAPPADPSDADAAQRARLWQEMLTQGPTLFQGAGLRRWATSQSPDDQAWLRRLVLARIEWNPGLLGPVSRTPHNAFEAIHWRYQQKKVQIDPEHVAWQEFMSPVDRPALSDGPNEPGLVRVSLLLLLDATPQQGLEVKLLPGVHWVGPGDRPCRPVLQPALQRFNLDDHPRLLPPFTVSAG